MNNKEAKIWILQNFFDGDENVEAVAGGDDECMAMKTSVEALEKRIPMAVIKDERFVIELCPWCHDFVRLRGGTPMNFCCNCGQALNWGDEYE